VKVFNRVSRFHWFWRGNRGVGVHSSATSGPPKQSTHLGSFFVLMDVLVCGS